LGTDIAGTQNRLLTISYNWDIKAFYQITTSKDPVDDLIDFHLSICPTLQCLPWMDCFDQEQN